MKRKVYEYKGENYCIDHNYETHAIIEALRNEYGYGDEKVAMTLMELFADLYKDFNEALEEAKFSHEHCKAFSVEQIKTRCLVPQLNIINKIMKEVK